MNCDTFNKNIYNLFDDEVTASDKDELLQHIESCQSCKKEYEEFKMMLREIKPSMQVQASINLKSIIMKQINKTENKRIFLRSKWTKIAAIAAIIVLAFILTPLLNKKGSKISSDTYAANAIFNKSIIALKQLKTIYAEFNIRTLDKDNFELIDVNADFVKHFLWKRFDKMEKWKIEKPGRTVLDDGENGFLYIKNNLAIKSQGHHGFVEWLRILLNPCQIMEAEKKFADEHKAEYKVELKEGQTILTIKAKAIGDFKNDYLLNKSILESNNIRIYTFDNATNRLKSMQIFIEKNNKSYLVFDMNKIKYDEEIPDDTFRIALPAGMSWKDIKDLESKQSDEIKNMKSNEIAKLFFESLSKLDFKTMKMVAPEMSDMISKNEKFKNYYKGLKIISIGKPFKSGMYHGEFVPYEIKFSSGEKKKMNLAVRNDNDDKAWKVDGGF